MKPVFRQLTTAALAVASLAWAAEPAAAQTTGKKPNTLVIMGDDIGWFNPSIYNRGMLGFETPNIDRIGKEGAMFMSWYGQQSCTAGRAAFVTGQSPIRTGLTKVGMPGADAGLREEDPSIAEVLKAFGYATGQFGKNHLGDKDEFLPTNHGFHEFFGNLYHLNAEEEPEYPGHPKAPAFRKKFGPRGVLHSYARKDRGYGTPDPQAHGDRGPGVRGRRRGLHRAQVKAGEALLLLLQLDAHAHHHAPERRGSRQDRVGDPGRRHDGARRPRRQLLKKLDDLGVAKDTI